MKCYLAISKWQISIQSTARRPIGLKGDLSMPKAWCFFGGILRPKRKKSYFCSGIFRRRRFNHV